MTFEKTEFEFPDEVSAKGKPSEDTDIEIVDDTPEADRGRSPMREAPVDPSDEELASYSDSIRSRIKHFSKGYHEERRAKEAASREKDEALRYAQGVIEENNRLKGSVNQGQSVLLEQAKRSVGAEIEEAKRELRAAKDAFDTDAEITAQQKLFSAQIKADRVNNFKPSPLQPTQNVVQPQQQTQNAPVTDPNLLAWQERNGWFGTNRKMTAYALGVHEDIVGDGVPVGSNEYYKRLDSDLQERFPDVVKAADGDAPTRRNGNVVAPATRSTAPKKIVLTQTQVSLAKRLGVPLELYARKVAETMRK
jgi:hypothetical protein